ncbi:MAG: lysylphosphatidylglycerol synthase transmembrane domain-containing protein [Xanthobacteraceae bacterium]
MKKKRSTFLSLLIKMVVTVSLITVVCMKVDFSALSRHLDSAAFVGLSLGTSLLIANVILVAFRWWFILRRLDVRSVPAGYAIATTYASVLVGQVTPAVIGADAARAWFCRQRGVGLRTAIMSLVTDRLLAAFGVVVVAAASIALFGNPAEPIGRIIGLLGTIPIIIAILFWAVPAVLRAFVRWPRLQPLIEMTAMFRLVARSRDGALAIALSCIVTALTTTAVVLFARGFNIGLSPAAAFLVVPISILVAGLPISIAGWGIREASLSYGLTFFGVAPQDAALLGLTLGVGLLLASLPGGWFMLLLGPKHWLAPYKDDKAFEKAR